MSTTRLSCKIAVLAMAAVPANAQAVSLFDSNDTLSITIEAPIRQLLHHRTSPEEYDAVLSYTDAAGVEHHLNFILTTRGHSRLELCKFPPLRLTFNPDDTEATVFESQHRLKMVTQCKSGSDAKNWVLQEFGVYRAYNAISDFSYRVRRLEVTFRDTDSKRWQKVEPAFLIESTSAAARRLQRKSIQPSQVNPNQFSPVETTHNLLFQFLIANTDFSVRRGPSGEECCHNGRVLAVPDRQSGWVVLPYDFDRAGIINTDYAIPHNKLPISRVTRRLYRGFCWQNTMLPLSIAMFNLHRSKITDALLPAGLGKNKRKRVLDFVDRFYEIVNDPERYEKEILDKCR